MLEYNGKAYTTIPALLGQKLAKKLPVSKCGCIPRRSSLFSKSTCSSRKPLGTDGRMTVWRCKRDELTSHSKGHSTVVLFA